MSELDKKIIEMANLIRWQYADKGEIELRTAMSTAMTKSAALAFSSSAADQAEAIKNMAIVEVCKNRLLVIKQKKEYREELDKKFEEELEERRFSAVMNLSAAISYEGQLIISILEDRDELSVDMIKNWGEEFSAMSDGDFYQLLSSLCDEGLIEKKETGYSLLTNCEDDLIPVYTEESIKKIFDRSQCIEAKIYFKEYFLMWKLMRDFDWGYIGWYDVDKRLTDDLGLIKRIWPEYADDYEKLSNKSEYELQSIMRGLSKVGLLVNNVPRRIYYVRLIGENIQEVK